MDETIRPGSEMTDMSEEILILPTYNLADTARELIR